METRRKRLFSELAADGRPAIGDREDMYLSEANKELGAHLLDERSTVYLFLVLADKARSSKRLKGCGLVTELLFRFLFALYMLIKRWALYSHFHCA